MVVTAVVDGGSVTYFVVVTLYVAVVVEVILVDDVLWLLPWVDPVWRGSRFRRK